MGVRDISVRFYELEYPVSPDVESPAYQTQQPAAPTTWYRYIVSGEGTIDGVTYSPGVYTEQAGPARTVPYTVTNGPLKFFDITPDLYTEVASVDFHNQSIAYTDEVYDSMVVYETATVRLNDEVVDVDPAVVAQASTKVEVDLVQPNTAVVLKVVPVEVQYAAE